MSLITYALQFRGQARQIGPGVLAAATRAPSTIISTNIQKNGLEGRIQPHDGGEAGFESEVRFLDDHRFEEAGTIDFGSGNRLRFHTIGAGYLGGSPDEHLQHGTVMWTIDEGDGAFRGATGLITSNFFVSDSGDVTDNHFGVIFTNES